VSGWAILRTIVLLGIGSLLWLGFRAWHAARIKASRPGHIYDQAHILQAPLWLALLCGRPLPDGELELVSMVLQIGSLFFILAVVPAVALSREGILGIVASVMLGTAVVAQIAVSVARRRGR